jgi:hypothetical protein
MNRIMKITGSAGRRNLFQDIMEKEVEDELKQAAVAGMHLPFHIHNTIHMHAHPLTNALLLYTTSGMFVLCSPMYEM